MVTVEELSRTRDAILKLEHLIHTDLCEENFIPEECTAEEVVDTIMASLTEWLEKNVDSIEFKPQKVKTYEPSPVEREHIAHALDESATEIIKEANSL